MLPCVGKYMPSIHANFPNQDVLNPIGPIFSYQPKDKDTNRFKLASEKEDPSDFMLDPVLRFPSVRPKIKVKPTREHIARENLRLRHVKFDLQIWDMVGCFTKFLLLFGGISLRVLDNFARGNLLYVCSPVLSCFPPRVQDIITRSG
jgi:hypothetical protein